MRQSSKLTWLSSSLHAWRKPYYCFHDADVRPEGRNFGGTTHDISTKSSIFSSSQLVRNRVKLLWGTANLFSNRRYMGGANQPIQMFALAAATVKAASTQRNGSVVRTTCSGVVAKARNVAANNTDLDANLTRWDGSSIWCIEYKHKIGFRVDPDRT